MSPPGSLGTPSLAHTVVATCFGTVIEWYDFAVFAQLTPFLSQVFFPASHPAAQKLQIWGIFAVSFFARPLGGVLFAHLGDTRGRGFCLLATVLTMGIPTVLIGFLPTFQHVGIAAACLLGLLRFIQGLAMGGEFGAAMVYMHEIVPPKWKSTAGALGYVSSGTGMILGNLVTLLVIVGTTAEDMLTFGWRVPFLVAFFSVEALIVLRWNLVDSPEFAASHKQLNQEYQHRLEQHKQQQHAAGMGRSNSNSSTDAPAAGATAYRQHGGTAASTDAHTAVPSSHWDEEAADGPGPEEAARSYVPVVELLRSHWRAVLLQIFAQAATGTWFYIATSWLATFFVRLGTPERLTLWMNMTGLVLMTAFAPVSGWLADQGKGRVTMSIIVLTVWSFCAVPIFLGFSLRHIALDWVLHNCLLALTGVIVGLLPSTFCLLYPAGVRVSGFNMGFSLSLIPFGGAVPLILTALQTSTGSLFIAPGAYAAGWGLVSAAAHVVILRLYPHVNQGLAYGQESGGDTCPLQRCSAGADSSSRTPVPSSRGSVAVAESAHEP